MQRMTRQRQAVLDLLTANEEFASAGTIHQMLLRADHRIGLATVYRTLQSFADEGTVDTLRSDDGEVLYRVCQTNAHHHHLVCRRCGRTEEIAPNALEGWIQTIADTYGFVEVTHSIELFGTCQECAAQGK